MILLFGAEQLAAAMLHCDPAEGVTSHVVEGAEHCADDGGPDPARGQHGTGSDAHCATGCACVAPGGSTALSASDGSPSTAMSAGWPTRLNQPAPQQSLSRLLRPPILT